jgi:hypothetical protein
MTHSTTSQVLHDQSVAKSTRYGITHSNKVQVHINRQPDLIPEILDGEVTYVVYTHQQ